MAEPRLEVRHAEWTLPRPASEALALKAAVEFVDSLLHSPLEPIPGSNGMSVMTNVYDPETKSNRTIVIREMSEQFWDSCLEVVNTPNYRYRVCVVGTPGTGKSSSIPLLIRMLLLRYETATVVYILRKIKGSEWYYEFKREGNVVNAAVYNGTLFDSDIPSLSESSTYFIVDPGDTTYSCGPPADFFPKTILVSSPDERHWGGSAFSKRRDIVKGVFKYYPIWTLNELIGARAILGPNIDVEERYRMFGGVPRMVFMTDDFEDDLLLQTRAVRRLTSDQAQKIVYGEAPEVDTLVSSQPKSELIGIMSDSGDKFRSCRVEEISPLVAEKICGSFMADLWNKVLFSKDSHSWKIFEAYTRQLMAMQTTNLFQARWCVGQTHDKYRQVEWLALGGCRGIRLTNDLSGSAARTPGVLFHPIDPQQKLIDFMYKDSLGVFHMFQVTLAKVHSANIKPIEALQDAVGRTQQVRLYYLVPDQNYQNFVTKPVAPVPFDTMSQNNSIKIYHVMIPYPSDEYSATMPTST